MEPEAPLRGQVFAPALLRQRRDIDRSEVDWDSFTRVLYSGCDCRCLTGDRGQPVRADLGGTAEKRPEREFDFLVEPRAVFQLAGADDAIERFEC